MNVELQETLKERQHAEHALQVSEQQYRTLALASPVGIIHTDIQVVHHHTYLLILILFFYSSLLSFTLLFCLSLIFVFLGFRGRHCTSTIDGVRSLATRNPKEWDPDGSIWYIMKILHLFCTPCVVLHQNSR